MKAGKEWWRKHFDPGFYNPADKDRLARAPKEADFVLRALGLKRGAGRIGDRLVSG